MAGHPAQGTKYLAERMKKVTNIRSIDPVNVNSEMKINRMGKISSLFLVILLTSCSLIGTQKSKNSLEKYSVDIDGNSRTYWVYSPSTVNDNSAMPVVFLFHGSLGSGKGLSDATGFNSYSEEEKIIAVYPDAQVGNWAEGCGCNNADRLGIKDPEFFTAMIDEVSRQYPVNSEQIFVAGFSQGGLFVNRLACEFSSRIQAATVIAASMSKPLSENCRPSEKISIKIIQGTGDTVLPYHGSDNGSLSLLSAKETASFWAEKNGIFGEPGLSYTPDSTNKQVERLLYGKISAGTTYVELLSIRNGGHNWPNNQWINANKEIVKMVRQD